MSIDPSVGKFVKFNSSSQEVVIKPENINIGKYTFYLISETTPLDSSSPVPIF